MLCCLHYFSFKCATDVKQMMKLFEALFCIPLSSKYAYVQLKNTKGLLALYAFNTYFKFTICKTSIVSYRIVPELCL